MPQAQNILIVGATRGLGAALANLYASQTYTTVYATTRRDYAPHLTEKGDEFRENIIWLTDIDVEKRGVGVRLVDQLLAHGTRERQAKGGFDVVIYTPGYHKEDYENLKRGPDWDLEIKTYTIIAISPTFIIQNLHANGFLTRGGRIVLVSCESGSITLRHPKEDGGDYAHRASKAALNMVGKLLSFELKDDGVIVTTVHPGLMREEMTRTMRGVSKYWKDKGAVSEEDAAGSILCWEETLTMEKTGEFWALEGPKGLATAEETIGKNLPKPLQLPW
ncbi:hypothetical protein ONS96_001132 [Cadophora gregata f. sp. sojae]|nr:hypothetical protein ONS96_001132 [Cadophora gregata f. sp. sojae]